MPIWLKAMDGGPDTARRIEGDLDPEEDSISEA
jgi:hypothetical protein